MKYTPGPWTIFLMDTILKVPEHAFPFSTKIEKVNDHYQFT